jgi:hypothetical protein
MSRIMRTIAACGAGMALAAVPAAAQAATLTNSGGTMTYTGGAPGTSAFFSQSAPGTVVLTIVSSVDPIGATSCGAGPNTYTCTGVTLVVADGGGGSYYLFSSPNILQMPVHFSGGDGDDIIGDGAGADTIDGGAGNDFVQSSLGADVVRGGAGIDHGAAVVSYAAPATPSPVPVTLTLDGAANDGSPGQGANFSSDIEDVNAISYFSPGGGGASQYGSATVTGDAGANVVDGDRGDDTVTGGAGNDTLHGLAGNDTLNARDGYADRVDCGDGIDTAVVDSLDQVSDNCENVSTADVGMATEDKPPTIAWSSPATGAKLPGSTLAALQVIATDDKAVSKVVFMDDDRVVCTDLAAPYTCAYQARGEDLGRNTLTAVASDALGQTASSVRTVLVTRFAAGALSLKVSPKQDKRAPYSFTAAGTLARPATVSTALACSGSVKITVKSGSRTLSTRTAKLSKTCTYKTRLSVSRRAKLKVRAAFAGNDAIAAKTSPTRTVTTK